MAAQGWCPSTYRLHQAPDGGLVRVRVPGGRLSTAQLRALADAAEAGGDGPIELTNRGNLQLRGVPAAALAEVRARLAPVGLSGPTAAIEDRRNVLASPAAGLDPDERCDVTPIVDAVLDVLDALDTDALVDPAALPHKFGVLLDGGGRLSLRALPMDVALGAIDADRFVVALGTSLDAANDHAPETGTVLTVERDAIPALVRAAARLCSVPPASVAPGRLDDVRAVLGLDRTVDALVARGACLDHERTPATATAASDPTTAPDRWRLVAHASVAARAVTALAGAIERAGLDEVRLTPWRSILVPSADGSLLAALAAAGWVPVDGQVDGHVDGRVDGPVDGRFDDVVEVPA